MPRPRSPQEFRSISPSHRALVDAVVYRCLDRVRSRADPSGRDWSTLRKAWQSRFCELAEVPELGLSDDRIVRIDRCGPPLRAGYRACRIQSFCPYCWSRGVLRQWRRVDRILFPSNVTPLQEPTALHSRIRNRARCGPTLDVVIREITCWISGETPDFRDPASFIRDYVLRTNASTSIYTRATGARHLLQAGAVGGVEILEIAPQNRASLDEVQFRARIAGVWLVPPADRVAFMAHPAVTTWARSPDAARQLGVEIQVKVHIAPTRRDFATLVGSAFRYPMSFMTGPVGLVAEALRARADRNLAATYGCLRSPAGSGQQHDPGGLAEAGNDEP